MGHDSGSSLVIDNQIIADVSEERFVRIKTLCGIAGAFNRFLS